jgi:hypothetical protein
MRTRRVDRVEGAQKSILSSNCSISLLRECLIRMPVSWRPTAKVPLGNICQWPYDKPVERAVDSSFDPPRRGRSKISPGELMRTQPASLSEKPKPTMETP